MQTLQIARPHSVPPTTAFVNTPSVPPTHPKPKMPWPWQSGSSSKTKPDEDDEPSHLPRSHPISSSHRQIQLSWNDSLNSQGCDHYKDPRNWIPAFAVTTVLFCGMKFYRTYLRRITNVEYIHPDLYRKRRLFGRVTSVGDGDGFHLFHTPGGKWAGWGWLRKVPTDRKELKGKTVCPPSPP